MPHMKPLLEQLAQGDEDAFDQVFMQFHHQVYLYCLKITKSSTASEDIMQEAFLTLWTKRKKINPDLSIDGFLFKITRDLSLNYLKKATRDQNFIASIQAQVVESTRTNTEDEVIFEEYYQIAREAIQKLPPKRRWIFKMNHLMGLTYEEIGVRMGISKNTVKSQLVKASQHMKAYFSTHGEITILVLFFYLI